MWTCMTHSYMCVALVKFDIFSVKDVSCLLKCAIIFISPACVQKYRHQVENNFSLFQYLYL